VDVAARDRWLAEAERRTRGAGMRSGVTRRAVMEILAGEGQCLMTAQDMIDRITERRVGSRASVYRVLDGLFELGLLHRFDGRDGVARFEIADPDQHHHHAVNEETGEISAFTDPDLEASIQAIAERLGLELTSHDVILRGTPVAGDPPVAG
jgi:Fur family transcriptional regulator, ferric uptake regulator